MASCASESSENSASNASASSDPSASSEGAAPDTVAVTSDPFVADGPRAQLLSALVADPSISDAQRTCIAAAIESFSDDQLEVIVAASEETEPNFDDPTFAKWVEASMGCMNAGASLIDQVKNRSNLVLDEVQQACVDGYLGELADEDLQALIDAPANPFETDLAACLDL